MLSKFPSSRDIIELRIGVHVGSVAMIEDINGTINTCGFAINYAQRVMDAAGPRQVLFSREVFLHYVGERPLEPFIVPIAGNEPCDTEKVEIKFSEPCEVVAKHGLVLTVYTMQVSPKLPWLNGDQPDSKDLVFMGLTELPKSLAGPYGERLRKAEDVAFVQLTGERFLDAHEAGDVTLGTKLERLWVFMPNPKSFSDLDQSADVYRDACLRAIPRWQALFKRLKVDYPNAALKLGLFYRPPFLGASYFDWEHPDGFIHVSPYIWNVAAQDCPGYELQWFGSRPTQVYRAYVHGLLALESETENIAFD